MTALIGGVVSVLLKILTVILVFSIIVIIHEFGHFIFAKLSGIKVEEFAVGMGPKLLSKKKGETVFSIRALPLGGFCKMLGEDESNNDPRAFNNKPVYKRISVIAFGPIMNLLLTILLLSFVVTAIQIPTIIDVSDGGPADGAGFEIGDKIVAIEGKDIEEATDVNNIISNSAGKNISITVERAGEELELNVTPVYNEEYKRALIGISMQSTLIVEGYSLSAGIKNTGIALREMYRFLGGLFIGTSSANDVVGPAGIVDLIGKSAKLGWIYLANLTAVISLNLFVINLLPLPALDGGRLVFLILEGVRRKPVDPDKEGLVHFVGFVLLMVLSAFILFKDLIRMNILNF
ncbi:MAG: RIP metalloprotease RseP [Bacillota bacterium]